MKAFCYSKYNPVCIIKLLTDSSKTNTIITSSSTGLRRHPGTVSQTSQSAKQSHKSNIKRTKHHRPVGTHTSMFSLLVKAVGKMRLWMRFRVW